MNPLILQQRIRNRIIENLERVLDSKTAPPALGFNELVNSWYDWTGDPLQADEFSLPVYTPEEDLALRAVNLAFDNFCKATPASIEDEDLTLALVEWVAVVSSSEKALAEIMKRGRLPEDVEIKT